MRYAVLVEGIVTNIVLWDGSPSTWTPPAGATMVAIGDEPCDIGWRWDGAGFAP